MAEKTNRRRTTVLKERMTRFLSSRSRWSRRSAMVLKKLRDLVGGNAWRAFLFGGVPRNFLTSGVSARIRDFDIVVEDKAYGSLTEALREHLIGENRFGGRKFEIDGVVLDVWALSSTWAFREKLVTDVSFESLPNTTFLNIDSILIELAPRKGKPRRILEAGFFRALTTRTLDVRLMENPFPKLCVIRTLRLAQRLELKLSRRLACYLMSKLDQFALAELVDEQMRYFGCVFFDESALLAIRAKVFAGLCDGGNSAIELFSPASKQATFWDLAMCAFEGRE